MKSKKKRMKKNNKRMILFVLIILTIIGIFYGLFTNSNKQTNIRSIEETEQELELENDVSENTIRRYY